MPELTQHPENETVILENDPRLPALAASPGGPPPHPHHNHTVVLKAGTNEVTMPPTYAVDKAIRYARTDRKNVDGLAIFKVA